MRKGGQSHFHLQDMLANVTSLTNSSGSKVESYQYSAFGKQTRGRPHLAMTDVENIHVTLGDSAGKFCRTVVAGHSAFGAPLQSRLQLQAAQAPFAYLPKERAERASANFVDGGIANEKTDETLIHLLCEWARSADRGDRGRLLVFEDTVAKRSDPSKPLRFDRYFEDWTYSVSPESPTDAELEQVVAGTASYPAVGVVSTPSLRTCKAAEFDERNLDDIAGSAVALLVRAWDDEAFIVLPLTDDLSFGST